MKNKQDHFEILRKIQKKPEYSQRELAEDLGFSLGKLNYCLKELKKKGLVKLTNFQKQSNKLKYLQYVITPKGITERTKLTLSFMKKKMKEFDELKKELENNN
jgi:EPS-associated MarR family transcriptional regulator